MKRLKILLVLIFSLFVTENLQDAEASGKSYISRSSVKGSDLKSLMKECKLWVEPEPMQKLERDLKSGKINDVITVLATSHNGFNNREWKKFKNSSSETPSTTSVTSEEGLNYLKFLASVTKSWFHTQYNTHVNTLTVEAAKEDVDILATEAIGDHKIFLFVSGSVPFTNNKDVGNLKNIIDRWKTLFASKKSAVYEREIEVIDIHTLLNIEDEDFKRFMHFSCNFYKSNEHKDYKGLKSYIGTDNEGNPKFNNIEKAIDDIYKNGTSTQFNEDGYFEDSKDDEGFMKLMEYLLKILSFCEISGNIVIKNNLADDEEIVKNSIFNISLYRCNIIKFLSGKMSPKELISVLVYEKKKKINVSSSTLLQEERHIFFKPVTQLLHTEKILATGLECLKLPDEIRGPLKQLSKNNLDYKGIKNALTLHINHKIKKKRNYL